MDVDDSRKYGLMRKNEGVSKWKIINSKIQANNHTLNHLESSYLKQNLDRTKP